MESRYVSRQEAINRIEAEIERHEKGKKKANSYSFRNTGARHAWVGHQQRIIALEETLRKINNGEACTRSIAQLFSAGYRIKD